MGRKRLVISSLVVVFVTLAASAAAVWSAEARSDADDVASSVAPLQRAALTGVRPRPATAPGSTHVVTIALENHEYNTIIGSPEAPYLNQLARRYGLATRYFANTHPSPPNYMDLIAGQDFGIGHTEAIDSLQAPAITDQLAAAGLTWKAYFEGMAADPTPPCPFPTLGTLYRKRLNPFAYFANVTQRAMGCRNVVPYSQFGADLARGLPNYAFVAPSMCNDMHNCSVATGDAWLRHEVPGILRALSGNDLLIIVFDEGTSSIHGGGHVVCIVAGPGAKRGASSSAFLTHFSLLKTIEQRFGLSYLGHAADPFVNDLGALIR